MKVKNIEIEEPPFSGEQIDECMKKIDFVVALHFAPCTNQLDAFIQAIDAMEGEDAGKVIYIHNYPEKLEAFIGVKYNKEFFNKKEGDIG